MIRKDKKEFPIALFAVVVLALAALGGGIWYLNQPRPSGETGPVLTAEGKAYTRYLELDDTQLKATDSYMTNSLVEIVGKITNKGERKVKLVELTCIFYDAYGQVVLRERVPIVRARAGGLAPGETKPYRMPFDSIPPSWNQSMPQLVVAQVLFD